jgi:hypothetical protein
LIKVTDVDRWTSYLLHVKDENYRRISVFDTIFEKLTLDIRRIATATASETSRLARRTTALDMFEEVGGLFAQARADVKTILPIAVSVLSYSRPTAA